MPSRDRNLDADLHQLPVYRGCAHSRHSLLGWFDLQTFRRPRIFDCVYLEHENPIMDHKNPPESWGSFLRTLLVSTLRLDYCITAIVSERHRSHHVWR